MHVFIDTNILLNFFHFPKEDLDTLNNVFTSHEYGAATVHLTQQVCDEFKRNRESKINEALKQFEDNIYSAQLPYFMKGYDEYTKIIKMSKDLERLSKSIMKKAKSDIISRNLQADNLIKEIFAKHSTIQTTSDIFSTANMRVTLGNPPGKNRSIGDAINWTALLQSVPDGEDLHIISADGDYCSSIDEETAHPYLEEEWSEKKKSSLHVYRNLSKFTKKYFDGVAFYFDKNKEILIDKLNSSDSFSTTHQLIAQLEVFTYFTLKEVENILYSAKNNDQFGRIITDHDISDFLYRIATPRLDSLSDPDYKEIVQKVHEEQFRRLIE